MQMQSVSLIVVGVVVGMVLLLGAKKLWAKVAVYRATHVSPKAVLRSELDALHARVYTLEAAAEASVKSEAEKLAAKV